MSGSSTEKGEEFWKHLKRRIYRVQGCQHWAGREEGKQRRPRGLILEDQTSDEPGSDRQMNP